MSLTLQSPQCFALAIIVFGFFGFLQGWKIALVLMAFTLAAILFLFIGDDIRLHPPEYQVGVDKVHTGNNDQNAHDDL